MKWCLKRFLLSAICSLIVSPVFANAQANDGSLQFGSSLKQKSKKKKLAFVQVFPSRALVTDELDSEKIETRMVVSDVLVLDKKGKTISGLDRSDFEVIENDVPQEIQAVTMGGDATGIGRSIILVIDYSQSVLPYVESSLDASKTLVDKLNPNDRMAIVTDDVELLEDFTSDKALLKEKLESLKERVRSGSTGKSRQYCALMAALRELVASSKFRPIIILQSDGDELMQLRGMPGQTAAGENALQYGFEDIVESAGQSGVTIYTIIPGPMIEDLSKVQRADVFRSEIEMTRRYQAMAKGTMYTLTSNKIIPRALRSWTTNKMRDQAAISTVAIQSGGWAENLTDPSDANAIYSRILNGINERYVIGYYPQDQNFDGSTRTVIVKVRGHPEYEVRGRKTYIAN